jgi:hypothetical protein
MVSEESLPETEILEVTYRKVPTIRLSHYCTAHRASKVAPIPLALLVAS